MTISDFRRNLKTKGHGPGANWLKADFHVHLPTSHDYQYKGEDAFECLGKALESSKLGFVILLKHETFATKAELDQLQRHCPSVTLIPGVEINVLVDALFKKIGKDYFFHCIVAADPADEDEYGHVLRSARDKFHYRVGEYPAGFRSSIVDVATHFREAGALFIPAHLHQAKSAETSRSIDDLYDDESFLGFVREGVFDALEVRQIETAVFFDGAHQTPNGLTIPHISCVQSSDAHHHNVVGRRATWVRVENQTFGELKAALALPHRVALTKPEATHARVIGLHVVGAFIEDVWLELNQGLNALIGGKGSGKTALLECLRFVLNTPVPRERNDEVQKHRQHILGSGGYVECLVQDATGNQCLIIRRADSSDRITITPDDGESRSEMASETQVFPISILGWHEIESVADHATARINILDRAGEPENIIQAYSQIRTHVGQARDTLPLLQRDAKRLGKVLSQFWELSRKRSTLTRLAKDQLSALQDQYDWFLKAEERLEAIIGGVEARRIQVADVVPSRIDTAILPLVSGESFGDLGEALDGVETRAKESREVENSSVNALQVALDALGAEAKSASAVLRKAFQTFREDKYTPAVEVLSPEDREVLTKQIQILEETKKLPSVESDCKEQLRELHTLAEQLHSSCEAVCNLRDRIVQLRSDLVGTLNSELPGVKLEFRRAANKEARDLFQGNYPTEGASLLGFVDRYDGRDAYEKLRDLFAKLKSLGIEQNQWTVENYLFDTRFVDLLDVIDDDDVGIFLEVGNRGGVEIQNLSAGQRCVAVFPLLLRNSRGPLVIDQPEDNLDNRYIADNIGPDLLNKKQSQQYLVTSHNANLVVLTDADLIVHIDSDGSHAEFPASGFLAWENSKIKHSVLEVLDGGEAALLARQKKYGIRGA
ncbi:MAG: hypothetical protein NPIRA05_04570 [Nitrospirales bacterium]|nr:MAG: hypothetical protein NPIRA05_04570 [Nitrospirales bacterium]GJL69970.1 MAG: hypothetical protein NPIRA06_26050 [Nitrospirales bacterium]